MKKIGAMKKVVAFMLSAMLMVCLGAVPLPRMEALLRTKRRRH